MRKLRDRILYNELKCFKTLESLHLTTQKQKSGNIIVYPSSSEYHIRPKIDIERWICDEYTLNTMNMQWILKGGTFTVFPINSGIVAISTLSKGEKMMSSLPSKPSFKPNFNNPIFLTPSNHKLQTLHCANSSNTLCKIGIDKSTILKVLKVKPLHCGNSGNILSPSNDGKDGVLKVVEDIGEAISTGFPIWVALGCLLGLVKPNSYNWVTPQWTMMGITLTMLGMGMTLTFDDLRSALAMPKELISGFVLQYSVMPLSGYFISKLLNLPSYYAAGLILVGCCPGGTASNIVTYIARGNVALSVLMTAVSTLSATVMTPLLTAKLAGQYVDVDAMGLLMSTLQVVLLPVLAGAFFNQYLPSLVKVVSPLMPPIAVLTVAILCGNAIAQNSSAILASGGQVVLAAFLLHASGFFFGYVLSRILKIDVSSSRTISIEVGMQNSVLGVVLATNHFGNPLTAVPCAVSSVCHSIFGSALAGIWRRSIPQKKQD